MKTIVALLLLLASTAHGATYWVSQTGNDGNQHCVNSPTQPPLANTSRTITQGNACLSGGDTLNIKSGTYDERPWNNEYGDNPGLMPPNGTGDTTRTKFVAVDGIGTVIIRPTPHLNRGILGFPHGTANTYRFFEFNGIVFDGFNLDAGVSGPGNISSAQTIALAETVANIRFRDSSVINSGFWSGDGSNHNGILGFEIAGAQNVEILGTCTSATNCTCKLTDNGRQLGDPAANSGNAAAAYHYYITGGTNVTIDGCYHARAGGYGVHVNQDTVGSLVNLIVRNSVFVESGITAASVPGGGQLTAAIRSSGSNSQVYNNIIYNGYSIGIDTGVPGPIGEQVYNNTVYNNQSWGIYLNPATITAKNNIFYNNAHDGQSNDVGNFGGTQTNNLCGSITSGSCAVTSNPQFVNATSSDFRLCTGAGQPTSACTAASPALGQGATLGPPWDRDFTGATRSAPYDIGAYKGGVGGVAPPIIAIVSPTTSGSFSTITSTVSLSGTSSSSGSTVTSVTWTCSRCTPTSGTASGTTSWTIASVGLSLGGTNDFIVTAHDALSSTSSANLSVAYNVVTLVAAYAFEEGSGTTVGDVSNHGHVGTLDGNVAWMTSGAFGGSIILNGIGSGVTIAAAADLDLIGGYTIALRLKPAAAVNLFRAAIARNYNYYLYASTDAGVCGSGIALAGNDLGTFCDTAALSTSAWTHLAATWDGATLKLYRDLSLTQSGAAAGLLSTPTGSLQIGASQFGETFAGGIDEVRIYSGPIPLNNGTGDACTDALPSLTKDKNCPLVLPTGPVLLFALDEGTGSTTHDMSGNNNNGSFGSGVTWAH
jgi:hypothetical protein